MHHELEQMLYKAHGEHRAFAQLLYIRASWLGAEKLFL